LLTLIRTQPEDIMIVADFADFCLLTFVLIDDLWDALPAHLKPRGEQSDCSNSELLTMVLVEECMGWDEETEAISQWRQHRDLFPHLPDRTRFNRRRRALTDALLWMRQRVACPARRRARPAVRDRQFAGAGDRLPSRAGSGECARLAQRRGGLWAGDEKKQTIFGYKLHLLVTLTGVIRTFSLAPASEHDITIAPELLGEEWDRVVLGDKGYISAPLAQALQEERQVTLITPPRSNQRTQRDPAFTRLLNGMRHAAQRAPVETINDQLEGQFRIGKNHAHTFGGLCARLASKLTAHTLCLYINRLLGKADALQIKALAFPSN